MNLIQLLTDQQAYEGITHSRWGASWNWRWRRVGDDEERRSPSPEPQTDSRSGLPMKNRKWRRLRLVDRDNSFSLIFPGKIGFYSVGFRVYGATRWGHPPRRAPRGARPGWLCPPMCPLWWVLAPEILVYCIKIPRKVLFHSENFYFCTKKQHHGSSAENSVSPVLVSFKSCKLESKTRGKAWEKVDTLETYQLPQA